MCCSSLQNHSKSPHTRVYTLFSLTIILLVFFCVTGLVGIWKDAAISWNPSTSRLWWLSLSILFLSHWSWSFTFLKRPESCPNKIAWHSAMERGEGQKFPGRIGVQNAPSRCQMPGVARGTWREHFIRNFSGGLEGFGTLCFTEEAQRERHCVLQIWQTNMKHVVCVTWNMLKHVKHETNQTWFRVRNMKNKWTMRNVKCHRIRQEGEYSCNIYSLKFSTIGLKTPTGSLFSKYCNEIVAFFSILFLNRFLSKKIIDNLF